MASRNFSLAAAFATSENGGYVADPKNGKHWSGGTVGAGQLIGSKAGCDGATVVAYMAKTDPSVAVTAAWMESLPTEVFNGIARASYWNALHGDDLPSGLDLMCLDFAWATDLATSARLLQRLIGVPETGTIDRGAIEGLASLRLPPLVRTLAPADVMQLQQRLGVVRDGWIGPVTLAAIAAQPRQRASILILGLGQTQAAFLRAAQEDEAANSKALGRNARRIQVALALVGKPA